jgi:hypothetical protein
MSDNGISKIIKAAYKPYGSGLENPQADCFCDEDLADYAAGVISGQLQKEDIQRHIIDCDACFSKVACCISTLNRFNKDGSSAVSAASIKKARSIPKAYNKGKGGFMKRNRFLIIAAIFFILSFFAKRYFLQFLAAAFIFGLKWIMDTGGSKALIMIYDAWQRRSPSEEKKPNPRL